MVNLKRNAKSKREKKCKVLVHYKAQNSLGSFKRKFQKLQNEQNKSFFEVIFCCCCYKITVVLHFFFNIMKKKNFRQSLRLSISLFSRKTYVID